MKRYLATIGIACTMMFSACDKMESARKVEDIQYLSIALTANPVVSEISTPEGLTVTFENFTEGFKLEKTLTEGVNVIDSLIPGIYSINITGSLDLGDRQYIINGSKVNQALMQQGEAITIDISGSSVGKLAFSEIFFAGSSPRYFRDQFYEIINNSDDVIYLDGIFFANLTPTTASTDLPTWPAEDNGRYVYAERVWQFPGNGQDYPLLPGEAISIAQFAANHKLPQYSPDSPIDASTAEFEFNMGNANFPDQPAPDMIHFFFDGSSSKGTVPQYLTSVFGGAYVIFRAPEDEIYDPVNNKQLQTRDLGSTLARVYAKIPLEYVIDAVEAGHNENMIAAKRVASTLDAGMTYVGATYNSLGVRRKVKDTREDGTPILQDTNNSTEDFERMVVPAFRFYGSGVPSWSHSLN